MSWIDRVKNDMIITTGDGQVYKPKWVEATKVKSYNFTEFTFSEVDGSLVKRKRPIGNRYNLVLFFTGDDNIEEAKKFDISSEDSRAWNIEHPLYDTILVQPTGLSIDNTDMNVSKIVVSVIETIADDNPKISVSIVETLNNEVEELKQSLTLAQEQPYDVTDISGNQTVSDKSFKAGQLIIKVAEAFEDYNNLYNQNKSSMNNALSSPSNAVDDFLLFLFFPGSISQALNGKLSFLQTQFNAARVNLSKLFNVSSKQNYQLINAATVSSMAIASANPQDGDYTNRNDVFLVINIILNFYNTYIEDLDVLQTDNGGNPDSFIPDPASMTQLSNIVLQTVSNLFVIALGARQERSIILEKDSNAIILTHRFYGLDAEDDNLNEFIDTNSIGLNEILNIKKGRKILFYTLT